MGGREGVTKPVAVAHCQAVLLRDGLGSIAVAHFQGVEDMLLDIVGVGLPAGSLDDQPEQIVIQVAVLEPRPDRTGEQLRRIAFLRAAFTLVAGSLVTAGNEFFRAPPKGCMLKQTRLRISAHVTLSLVVRREARF